MVLVNLPDIVRPTLQSFENLRSRLTGTHAVDKVTPLTSWDDELGRFRLWIANIGAHQRGRSSLEYRLRDASHVKKQIGELLENLQRAIVDGGEVLDEIDLAGGADISSKLSQAGDYTPQVEMQQIHHNLSTIIECLFQMSMLVRNQPVMISSKFLSRSTLTHSTPST